MIDVELYYTLAFYIFVYYIILHFIIQYISPSSNYKKMNYSSFDLSYCNELNELYLIFLQLLDSKIYK
jgi:hypothetical protein